MLLVGAGYGVYLRIHSRRIANERARSTGEPDPRDAGAKLIRLVGLARQHGGVWEPESGILSDRFVRDMTPEVFTSAPWIPPPLSMPELLDVVERSRRLFVSSPRLFGAMSFAVEEAGLRDPSVRDRARETLGTLRADFIAFHRAHTPGFEAPPSSPARDPLNAVARMETGSFVMGSRDVYAAEHRVHVSAFAIQKHEVTNEEYRRFDPRRPFPPRREKHPVDSVDWYDAQAYAAWLGGSLPTEAQWEFAARGTAARAYPWGNQPPTRERANFFTPDARPGSDPVGSHPRGTTPEGVEDMAGNVWEWCRDWFDVYRAGAAEVENDPLGPLTGTGRVLRGGSYFYDATLLRAAVRNNDLPGSRYLNFGFRTASSLLER
jgi:formylglycine-generating enzyme required for sulfatase activity